MSRFSGQRKVFADAGFLIALFSRNDALHETAKSLFRDAIQEKVEIHSSWPVVSEAVTLLRYHFGYGEAAALLKALDGFHIHLPTGAECSAAAELFLKFSANRKISFTDVLSLAMIKGRLRAMTALSFDKDFPALGLTVIR